MPPNVRKTIGDLASKGLSITQVSEKIIDEYAVSLSFEAVKRWMKKGRPQTDERRI